MTNISTLAKVINNPGLHHLAEEIFWNLNSENLENCEKINQSANQILQRPLFWLKKWVQRGLSKNNQEEWRKAIQSVKNNSDKEKHVASYLQS